MRNHTKRVTELPPTTEKETENTTSTVPVRPPPTAPVQPPAQPPVDVPGGGRVGTVPGNVPAVVDDTPASPKDTDVNLIIPEGISKIPLFKLLMTYTTAGTTASYWCFQCA